MKKSIFSIQQWEEIVNHQYFDGTINQFCQEKGITKSQLYYYSSFATNFDKNNNLTSINQFIIII